MLSVLEIVRRTTDYFAGRGVESPRLNAELLVGHALGLKRMQLYLQFERLLTEAELERIRPLVRRRGGREPLQYIVGETEFHGLRLKVDRRALVPRPETERLVELVLARAVPPPLTALDLGTGTGAIACALAVAWPEAQLTAVDRDSEALALATENATQLALAARVRLVLSDWFAGLGDPGERFGVIVSNPPYLSAEETARAEPEVREHEPAAALVAERSGLAALEAIIAGARERLHPGGFVALETGPDQHPALADAAARAGWKRFESAPDLAGRNRYVFLSD